MIYRPHMIEADTVDAYRKRVKANKRRARRAASPVRQDRDLVLRNRRVVAQNEMMEPEYGREALHKLRQRELRWAAAERAALRLSGSEALELLRLNKAIARATPSWANRGVMLSMYKKARKLTVETGFPHEISHIVPILDPFVCGLNCEANLQIKKTVALPSSSRYGSAVKSPEVTEIG